MLNYQQLSKEDLIGELVKLHQRVDQLKSALNNEKAKSKVILDNAEFLQALMNHNPCLVFLKDEAGRYIYLNETYEKRFVGSKDWYGKTDFDFWSEESAQLFQANDEFILKSGQVYHHMEDSTGLDGNRYCWLCYKFPYIDSNNRKYLAGIGIDATRWVLAEEEVRRSRNYLEEIVAERTSELSLERQRLFDVLETLDVNICLLTTDYQITFTNRAYRERFGESNGRPCYEYVFGLDKPCTSCQCFQALETGQPHHWLFSAPDGSIIDVHDYPFTDADGKSLILKMNTDITERRKMETELARLDRLNLIGEMAASIGHEIRNPMTSVRGFLQLLGSKKEYQNDSSYFDLMIEELDRANSIITEYLSMAKDKTVDLQPKSLDYLVTNLYPIIKSDANLREINIHLDLNNPPEPLIDVNEIRQLIMNMVHNGMEAMSDQGTLTIGTMLEEEHVLLYIKDEGHGLKPDVIGKLGTPFFTTKANGTGLGLAVCYSIAARHKAKIDFETGSSGTTFYVRFPLRSDQTAVDK